VKPANVMLAQMTGTGDHVRILDFGLAKLRDADASNSSLVVGTPSYMSPEQASGKKVDARCDVYATGVVLFELLTGEKPFFSDQAFEVIRMHLETRPPRLADKLPGASFSPELEAMLARALAKAPGESVPDAGRLRRGARSSSRVAATSGRAQTPVESPAPAVSATASTVVADSISRQRPRPSAAGRAG
jgi:serine/threonine-protein kinase